MRFFVFLFTISSISICKDVQYDFHSLELSPIGTFENACARCHGSQGSFYGEAFANLEPEKLKQTVKEMMEGPAFLQPTEIEIDAMVAYHKALAAQSPFIVINNVIESEQEYIVTGETQPDTKLLFTQGKKSTTIEIDEEGSWKISLSSLDKSAIIGALNGKTVTLNPLKSQWK